MKMTFENGISSPCPIVFGINRAIDANRFSKFLGQLNLISLFLDYRFASGEIPSVNLNQTKKKSRLEILD